MDDVSREEVDRILTAIADLKHPIEIAPAVVGLLNESDTPEGRALLWAFQQHFRLGDIKSAPPFWEDRYGGGETKVPAEHREALLVAAVSPHASALVRGHLGSLLWFTSPGRDVLEIVDAGVEALIEVGTDTSIAAIERYGYLTAAADLAKRRKDAPQRDLALSALLDVADEVLGLGPNDEQPGTLMLTIGQFLRLGGESNEAVSRLEKALVVFEGHSHARQDIAAMLMGLGDTPESRAAVANDEVTRLIVDASKQPGFLKENTLRRALTLARQNGLRDRAGEVSSLLAAISPDDYDFKVTELSIKFSRDEIDELLAPFQPGQDIQRGFIKLGLMFPTFLPPEERPERPRPVMEQLATVVNISEHGHAEYTPSSDAQRETYRIRQEDMLDFQVRYNFILQGLQDMLAQPEGLAAFRAGIDASPILSDKGKTRAHKALDAYLARDWDTVSDTLPTIEAAVRMLSLSSGINIYAPAGEANEFKTLGGLLLDLEGLGDKNVRRLAEYWRFALTDSLGLNIRNDYLHGLKEDATPMTATVIMHIYSQLITFVQPGKASEDGSDPGGES